MKRIRIGGLILNIDNSLESRATFDKNEADFVLQKVQPVLQGLMDGSLSTLAPIFATAGLTGQTSKHST